VVVINQRTAHEYWPGENPIGKRVTFNPNTNLPTWVTVIGIAANEKQENWAAEPDPAIYLPALQNRDFLGANDSHVAYITLVLRTEGNPADLAAAVKRTVWSFDRNLPISEVLTMDRVVADATAQPRFEMLLLGIFAAVALVLAAIGIYGVMNYSVSRRRREIGIRISLGASRADVLRMVMQQGMLQVLAGTAAGIAGALLLSKLIAKMLYGVQPADPVTFGGVAVVLGLAALLAVCIPARRATRIDPMVALRNE
jgi:predicted permease